ncbi:ATP-grasp ribosomal peptide maturase [Olivibacter ginsenosidimutans]|uniref:ATP-grasp ribosomal peptide maturase n=1 Tax=Olivibacter ginsenosidimutans TaxID=1176537 RepID=A0ABP9BFU0_9SPHI
MIFCITHTNDFYTIDIVQNRLQELGFSTFRFNSDTFATQYKIEYKHSSQHHHYQHYYLRNALQSIDSSKIQAVWYRKLWDLTIPEELDPDFIPIFVREYQTALQLFFNSIEDIPWMNVMKSDHAVGADKMQQLYRAHRIGLSVPKTIISNDAAAIRDFFKHCKGNIIMKLHNALSKSMHGDTPFFPTTKVDEADLKDLDALAYCPMIFQEYISKAYELRVIYIDGVFFTGKIPNDDEKTDWRISTGQALNWEQYELPQHIKQKIQELMVGYGLHFGAIDLIRNIKGEYIFLEVNPQGEWGMLQQHLAYPIGETIAEKLVASIKDNG